jgi:septal ring factor EnvC (AmiA/AmiB activator)
MARHRDEARTKAVPAGAPALRGGEQNEGSRSLQLKLAALARERDALQCELRRSEARVQQLEDIQAQVRERIAWTLDALQNLLATQGLKL